MDSPSLINTFKRFISVPNFLGTDNQGTLQNEEIILKDISETECEWIFDPPHSSNFGGLWERKIDLIKQCLVSPCCSWNCVIFEGQATHFCSRSRRYHQLNPIGVRSKSL